MLRDELASYSTCEIRPVEMTLDEMAAQQGTVYASKIINVNLDETIDIAIPVFMDKQIDLQRNTRYSFLFHHEASMKTAHGVFLQRIRIDNVPMAKIKLVTTLKKIQRRDYFRIGCKIDMQFQVVSLRADDFLKPDYLSKVSGLIDPEGWKEASIVDISGGGMKFVTEAPILDLPFIFSTFVLKGDGKEKRIGITGKILSRMPVPRSLMCTQRVKFTPERSPAQSDILAFVYQEQLKLAKNKK